MKVHIPNTLMIMLQEHVLQDAPNECCGLLVGAHHKHSVKITELYKSQNQTSGNPTRSFEVDPKLRFDVMRDTQSRDDGVDIIGHYHSHPNGPAEPSATDLSMAYEPDMVWIICGMPNSKDIEVGAYKVRPDRSAFDTLQLVIESN